VHPDTPVDPRRVVGSESLDVDGTDAAEPAPVDQLTGELVEERCEGGKRKVSGGDVKDFVTDGVRVGKRRIELVEMVAG
jgi:hypothetical protein